MRTFVYIDGFNLYYGAVKGTAFKWLNLKELIGHLVPTQYRVEKVKYFTAPVSGAVDPDAPRRQKIYLNALRTVPEIEIYYGNFLSKTIWRPLINLPVANRTIATPNPVSLPPGDFVVNGGSTQTLPVGSYGTGQPAASHASGRNVRPLSDAIVVHVHTMEEKGSDVNLAVHVLNDVWKDLYDAAVVISNDTDLTAPIQMVTQERQKSVFVVCPGRWNLAPKLDRVATFTRHIRSGMLRASQFPDLIPGTTIRKPATW